MVDDLKKLIQGDVLGDEATLKKYSRDASLFEVMPQVVVYPKNVEDIKKLVTFAREHNASLTPRSGGTDMTGGAIGESIVLDMTRYFNQVKEVGDNYAVVQPGVFYRDFEKETLKRNLLLPSYPASREICTVGGMVANNSGGEKTLAYGKTEDYVIELKAVMVDGNEYTFRSLTKRELDAKMNMQSFEGDLYRKLFKLVLENNDLLKKAKPKVSKNSAGYYLWNVWDGELFDVPKLITGSQGTLCIITEITFKLIRPKKHSRMAVIFLRNLKPLVSVVQIVMKHKPESFESFDDHTLKLALRYLPELLKLLKGNSFKLAIDFLPEAWMVLTGGAPKLMLFAEFTDDDEQNLQKRLSALSNDLQKTQVKFRVLASEQEAQKYWVIRRESFNLLRHHLKDKRTAPFIDDFIVRVEQLPEFLPEMTELLEQYNLVYTIAGHVGNGNFHIIPLMDVRDPKTRDIIKELSEKMYDLVLSYGGSITAEHNDGIIRTPYLKKMYGEEVYHLFEETKRIFDPDNIFNPGKKVGGDLKYAFDHLVKS